MRITLRFMNIISPLTSHVGDLQPQNGSHFHHFRIKLEILRMVVRIRIKSVISLSFLLIHLISDDSAVVDYRKQNAFFDLDNTIPVRKSVAYSQRIIVNDFCAVKIILRAFYSYALCVVQGKQ